MVGDFDRSSGERVVLQIDKVTGLPLWVVEVIDADEQARQRMVKVRVATTVQPVSGELRGLAERLTVGGSSACSFRPGRERGTAWGLHLISAGLWSREWRSSCCCLMLWTARGSAPAGCARVEGPGQRIMRLAAA